MAKRKNRQTEADIDVLKGLEAVRKKPQMYIGPTDANGIFTILREACDNSVDEFLADNECDSMTVCVYGDGRMVVHDNGGGIPVGAHAKEKVSTLEVAVGMLHAGGKLHSGGSTYKASRGTHGIGVSATNALSSEFKVFTKRGGAWWTVAYKKGKLAEKTRKLRKREFKDMIEPLYDQGTIVVFEPDPSIFGRETRLDTKQLLVWAKNTAYLAGGFEVSVVSEEDEIEETYLFEGGLSDWIGDAIEEHGCGVTNKDPVSVKGPHVDLCLSFTDLEGCGLSGYCNGLEQVDGGQHVSTTLSALLSTIKPYAAARDTFTREDLAEGVLGIVNFKVDSPQFSSQTKEKLADTRFDELCKDDIVEGFTEYWSKNKILARELCRRASDLRALKADHSAAKKAMRALKKRNGESVAVTNRYYSPVRGVDPEEREVFLVEGESAGGTARSARMTDPYPYQETLGLKGKVSNAYQKPTSKMLESAEVLDILSVVGYDPAKNDPLEKPRAGKIILLSDPDPDGKHIDALLMALLQVYAPTLIEDGRVFRAVSPKYKLVDRGKQYFGMTVEEIAAKVPKSADIRRVTYMKGWGEANKEEMQEIAFNPATRRIKRIETPDEDKLREVRLLMGKDTRYRKELIGVEVTG